MSRTFAFLLCLLVGLAGSARADDAPAFQSDPRDTVSTDRTVDILSLTLDVALDLDAGRVSGTATHRVRPLRTGLKEVRLHGVGLDVEEVTIDGAPTTVRILPEQLAIALPAPTDPAVEFTIAIRYAAEPDTGLHFRRPGDSPDTYTEVWSQGEDVDNRHWFPTWDAPDDRFTYTGRFTAPSRYTVLSNGRLTNKDATPGKPGWTTWTYALQDQDLVSYLVMVAAAEYKALGREWRGRPVLDFYPPDVDEATVRRATERVPDMLDFMSSATGVEYPYPGYSQVFVQRFIYTGMENTTATVLHRRLLYPEREAAHSTRTESVIAHELAHQWFGDQITLRDWSHMWLNEGMTTFLEGWWLEYAHGPERYADRVFGRYQSVIRGDDRKPRPMVVDFHSRDGDRVNAHSYTKGASLMQMLRVMLGDEDFGRAFRAYCAKHQGTTVETSDLQRVFEETTGLHLDWFFQQWVDLAGHPKLSVGHSVDAEQGTVRVTVEQTQKREGLVPLFTLPVDLAIATDAGVATHRVWLEAESASLVLPLDGALQYVGVDPSGGLLADITQKQTDAEWTAQLQGGSSYSRRLAFDALKKRKSPPSEGLRAAVNAVLADGEAPGVWRQQAAVALGAWKDDTSRATLLGALGSVAGQPNGVAGIEADPKLQESIIDALGGGARDDAVVAGMRSVWAKGATDTVRASALQVLGKLLKEDALPDMRRALGGPAGHSQLLHYVAVSAIGSHGVARDLKRLAPFRQPTVPHRLRATAFSASARIASRQTTKDAREAARAVVAKDAHAVLGDLNLRGLQSVVGTLRSVGDGTSIPLLQGLQASTHVTSLQGQIESAIEAIRTRKDTDPKPDDAALTAKLKKLEEQITAMQDQLRALEERQ